MLKTRISDFVKYAFTSSDSQTPDV